MNLRRGTAELLRSSPGIHDAFLMGRWLAARNFWMHEARKGNQPELKQVCVEFARNNHRAFLKQRRLLKSAL